MPRPAKIVVPCPTAACLRAPAIPHMLLIVEPWGQRRLSGGLEGNRDAYARMVAFGENWRRRALFDVGELAVQQPGSA